MKRLLAIASMTVLVTTMNRGAAAPPEAVAERVSAIKQALNGEINDLVALYKKFHASPELGLQEEQTSLRLAGELRKVGCEVTERVGGYGVVGVLKNGPGPTVLVRADMDGLPIIENTGVPYISKVRTRDKEGKDVGVMHACGHDINMTSLIGTARALAGMKDRWSGTVLFIGQPAEEIGAGARMMIADGLFKRFPRPDYGFALHCDGRYAHGTINFREGLMQANVDSVDITVRGKGGHGAAPNVCIDPIVLAARIVLDLQTIVSRERNPVDPAVVTVGSIHGGSKHNIIPNEVKLQLTVRTTNDRTRKEVLESIARIARAAAMGARAPEPIVEYELETYTPALYNDLKLTRQTVTLFKKVLGEDGVIEREMSMGGEDFSQFARAGIKTFYWHLGTQDPAKVAEAKRGGVPLPSLHSDAYFPIPEPTIRTGVVTMSMAVLDILGK